MEPGLYETATYRAQRSNFLNGCHVCEVEIDPETGSTQLIGYWVVDDVGTVINPMLVKGQSMGGIAQGWGQVLMEDKSYDDAAPINSFAGPTIQSRPNPHYQNGAGMAAATPSAA